MASLVSEQALKINLCSSVAFILKYLSLWLVVLICFPGIHDFIGNNESWAQDIMVAAASSCWGCVSWWNPRLRWLGLSKRLCLTCYKYYLC